MVYKPSVAKHSTVKRGDLVNGWNGEALNDGVIYRTDIGLETFGQDEFQVFYIDEIIGNDSIIRIPHGLPTQPQVFWAGLTGIQDVTAPFERIIDVDDEYIDITLPTGVRICLMAF